LPASESCRATVSRKRFQGVLHLMPAATPTRLARSQQQLLPRNT
jgi:hypothetical protein